MHTQYKYLIFIQSACVACELCLLSAPCSVLHLLHHPRRAAGEPTGAGGVRAQRAGGDDSIGGQLLRAGDERPTGAAGEEFGGNRVYFSCKKQIEL